MSGDPFSLSAYSAVGNPYLFTGRITDTYHADSTADTTFRRVQDNRNRIYDPKHGRWIQTEPLGVTPDWLNSGLRPLIQYRDGMNLKQYVQSLPTTLIDPLGKTSSDPTYGLPKEFWNWLHRFGSIESYKDCTGLVPKDVALQLFEEWKADGRPMGERARPRGCPRAQRGKWKKGLGGVACCAATIVLTSTNDCYAPMVDFDVLRNSCDDCAVHCVCYSMRVMKSVPRWFVVLGQEESENHSVIRRDWGNIAASECRAKEEVGPWNYVETTTSYNVYYQDRVDCLVE